MDWECRFYLNKNYKLKSELIYYLNCYLNILQVSVRINFLKVSTGFYPLLGYFKIADAKISFC